MSALCLDKRRSYENQEVAKENEKEPCAGTGQDGGKPALLVG
jgi:hypothetical protein